MILAAKGESSRRGRSHFEIGGREDVVTAAKIDRIEAERGLNGDRRGVDPDRIGVCEARDNGSAEGTGDAGVAAIERTGDEHPSRPARRRGDPRDLPRPLPLIETDVARLRREHCTALADCQTSLAPFAFHLSRQLNADLFHQFSEP